MLKAVWKSRRDSRLRGVGRVSLGKHEGGRGSPSVPRDSICPWEPDPAQGHCPQAPGQAGGASQDPRPQEAPEPRLEQEEGLQRGQDPLYVGSAVPHLIKVSGTGASLLEVVPLPALWLLGV